MIFPHFIVDSCPICTHICIVIFHRCSKTTFTILSLNRHTCNTCIFTRAILSMPDIGCIRTRISVSMMTATPKSITGNSFTIVNCYVVVFPVEIIFSFKIQYLTCSSWSQYYVFVIKSCRIISRMVGIASVIINSCVTSSIFSMSATRTRHNNIIGAIDSNRHRPSTSLRSIAVEDNGQLIAY